jgi:uncharacterized protein
MDIEVLNKSIEFIERQYKGREIKLNLYGGEPFLNFDLIKYIHENYYYLSPYATTNGIMVYSNKNILSWVKDNCFNIVTSATPIKRFYGSSYIEPLIELSSISKSVNYLIDNPKDKSIIEDIKLIIGSGAKNIDITIPRESQSVINNKIEYISILKDISDVMYSNERSITSNLDKAFKINLYKRESGCCMSQESPGYCGAGINTIAIDCNGDIYPCDTAIPDGFFLLGNVFSGVRDMFSFMQWSPYEYCNNCPLGDIRLCMQSMCCINSYHKEGNMFKPTSTACAVNEILFSTANYIIDNYRR